MTQKRLSNESQDSKEEASILLSIRATRGRNQIVFTHKLKFIKTSAHALA
jgi:hypothetical protein